MTANICIVHASTPYLLDSGASCHITNGLNGLYDIREKKNIIVVGGNLSCKTFFSKLILMIIGNHVPKIITVYQIFFVPQFNKKIVSISINSDQNP